MAERKRGRRGDGERKRENEGETGEENVKGVDLNVT